MEAGAPARAQAAVVLLHHHEGHVPLLLGVLRVGKAQGLRARHAAPSMGDQREEGLQPQARTQAVSPPTEGSEDTKTDAGRGKKMQGVVIQSKASWKGEEDNGSGEGGRARCREGGRRL